MRASTNSLVVAITMGSDSLFDDSLELVDARHGIRHLGVNGLLGV